MGRISNDRLQPKGIHSVATAGAFPYKDKLAGRYTEKPERLVGCMLLTWAAG